MGCFESIIPLFLLKIKFFAAAKMLKVLLFFSNFYAIIGKRRNGYADV